MGDPVEDAKKEKEELLQKKKQEAKEALAAVYKDVKVPEAAKKKLDAIIIAMYSDRAQKAITTEDVQNALKTVLDQELGKPTTDTAATERKALLGRSVKVLAKFEKDEEGTVVRDWMYGEVSGLVDNVAKVAPDFPKVAEARKYVAMETLAERIPKVLAQDYKATKDKTVEDLKEDALKTEIAAILMEATSGELKDDILDSEGKKGLAVDLAKEIVQRDKALREEMKKFLEEEKITGPENPEVKKKLDAAKSDDVKKAIMAADEQKRNQLVDKISSAAWPEMLRQNVPDRGNLLKAAIADSVRSSTGPLTDDQQKSIDDMSNKLNALMGMDAYKNADGTFGRSHLEAISAVRKAAGNDASSMGAFIEKLQLGWGAGGGAAAGVAWSLMSEDFSSIGSVARAALKTAGLAVVGNLAYDQNMLGLFDKPGGPVKKPDATGKGSSIF